MARIIVGVDGSAAAEAALEWAWQEAQRRGATLRIVSAAAPVKGSRLPTDEISAMEPLHQSARQEASRAVEQAMARLGDRAREGSVEPVVVDDTPVQALIREASGADLLVVGTRGRGGLAGLLLGSVSQQCTQHAPCPVVVVPAASAEQDRGAERLGDLPAGDEHGVDPQVQ